MLINIFIIMNYIYINTSLHLNLKRYCLLFFWLNVIKCVFVVLNGNLIEIKLMNTNIMHSYNLLGKFWYYTLFKHFIERNKAFKVHSIIYYHKSRQTALKIFFFINFMANNYMAYFSKVLHMLTKLTLPRLVYSIYKYVKLRF